MPNNKQKTKNNKQNMIASTAEIQQYVSVDINFQQKSLLPYIEQAKTQIVRLLGKAQYEALKSYYDADTPVPSPTLDNLLPYVQRPLANFAIFYGLSALNVVVGPTGIGVVSNQNVAPASKDRTDALRKDLMEAAQDAMETLLMFLEENVVSYPLWEDSEAYFEQYSLLITSARRFDEEIHIERSRLKFLEWRPLMRDVETLEIAPQISKEYLAALKERQRTGELTDPDKEALPLLQKALAYLTSYRATKEEDHKLYGTHYLMSVKGGLDENPDDYPIYKASTVFKSPEKDYRRIKNTDESKFFWM